MCAVKAAQLVSVNHFNPRDFQNNLASDSFGAFTNGVGVKFGSRISFSKKQ